MVTQDVISIPGEQWEVVQSLQDRKWTNWSISRMMLLDKNKMTGIVDPHQHLGMIHNMWKRYREAHALCSRSRLRAHLCYLQFVACHYLHLLVKVDYAGAYFGEPIDVVKCETSDLGGSGLRLKSLVGDDFGTQNVRWKVRWESMPVTYGLGPLNTNRSYVTSQPSHIAMTDSPRRCSRRAGRRRSHLLWDYGISAEMLFYLREKGIPATMVWSPLATACHWWVVTVPVNYRTTINCTKEELCRQIGKIALDTKLGSQIPKMMVIHDDIDPTNLQELVWGFATRCRPGEGEILFHHAPVYPLIAFTTKSEKATHDGTKSVYNCLGPDDWGDKLPERSSFRFAYPQDLQEAVLANWRSYGFAR